MLRTKISLRGDIIGWYRAEEIPQEKDSIIKEKEKTASVPANDDTTSKSVQTMLNNLKFLLENESVIQEIYKASDFLKKARDVYDLKWLFKNRDIIETLFSMLSNLQ